MKVIICGGGTGGHIYPGLSIADSLHKRNEKVQILYIGTASGLESSLVPKQGYEFKAIRVKGFRRRLSTDTVKSSVELIKGLSDANRIISKYKPDIVVGTGGYVAGPVLLVAHLRGVPTLIHEQNVLPGATNRILGRFVDVIAVSFEEAIKYFGKKKRVFVTGNPIRREILGGSREEGIKEFGFTQGIPFVLCFGGSKGSGKLNQAMVEVIANLHREGGFQLLHITGEGHYNAFLEALKARKIEPGNISGIRVMPYLHRMPQALAAADLVISSAGAITIAEITAVGIPALLIPKSHVVDNHQEYNARMLERKGAAVVLLEKQLDGDVLYNRISEIIRDAKLIMSMKEASKKIGKADAAERICDIIIEMLIK